MDRKQINKLLGLSLISYTIGGFMFAIGLMMKNTLTLIVFYIIAMLMMISSMLALYNNYKKNNKIRLYLFLDIIGLVLACLITVSMISSL